MSRPLQSDFLVRPLETVHFGAPQSFSAGESHHARSEFPPSPFSFQGLVHTQLLRAADPPLDLDDWSHTARAERADLVGEPEMLPTSWQLQGPYPAQHVLPPDSADWEEPWLILWVPTPRFLLRLTGRRTPMAAQPARSTHPYLSDLGAYAPLLGLPREGAVGPLGGWIDAQNLLWALSGRGSWHTDQYADELPPFVRRELRPGLAIDRETATAQHAMLYFLDSLRFHPNTGLYGHFRGQVDERIPIDALETGAGTAGRKGRPVAFQRVSRLHPAWTELQDGRHLPTSFESNASFWLTSLAPAYIPDPRAPQLHTALPTDVRVRIHATLTGTPQIIGGYAMASGSSRPNRVYVPAGSAWWCTLEGGDTHQRAATLRLLNNAHTLGEPREALFGFGHTLVGLGPTIEKTNP